MSAPDLVSTPDRDRLERIAASLLSAWFAGPSRVGDDYVVDHVIGLAMKLISAIDKLGLPLPPSDLMHALMQGMVEDHQRAQKVMEAQEAERMALLREHNDIFHGGPSKEPQG